MAPRNRLGEMLVRAGVLDAAGLAAAQEHQVQWGSRLTRAIRELALARDADVTRALAAGIGIKALELDSLRVDPAALAKLDLAFAEQHGVFPVAMKEGGRTLLLAMADPSDLGAQDAAALKAKVRILPALISEGQLERAIARHYRGVELDEHGVPAPDDAGPDDLLTTHSSGEPRLLPAPRAAPRPVPSTAELRGSAATGAPGQSGERPRPLTQRGDAARPFASALDGAIDPSRVATLLENQRKSAAILRALRELLEERGLIPQSR